MKTGKAALLTHQVTAIQENTNHLLKLPRRDNYRKWRLLIDTAKPTILFFALIIILKAN